MITFDPIGYFHSNLSDKADLPRQGSLETNSPGIIRFISGKNYEQALENIEGMERLWVLYWMHKALIPCLKVQPPRPTNKKGVFSTRSPHRPNPIGLSCVRLLSVNKLELLIDEHDLLNGSPILDIKPYLPYADSFPEAHTGWIADWDVSKTSSVNWSILAVEQLDFLVGIEKIYLRPLIEKRLQYFVAPTSSNRVKHLKETYYLLAYKQWRLVFEKLGAQIVVLFLCSGFSLEGLEQEESSVHRQFLEKFQVSLEESIEKYRFLPKILELIPSIGYK